MIVQCADQRVTYMHIPAETYLASEQKGRGLETTPSHCYVIRTPWQARVWVSGLGLSAGVASLVPTYFRPPNPFKGP